MSQYLTTKVSDLFVNPFNITVPISLFMCLGISNSLL